MKKINIFITLIMLISVLSTGVSPVSADDTNTIFELTEEEVDSFLKSDQEHKYLRPAAGGGKPVYSKAEGGGIRMTGRDADWQSLDIRSDWMEEGWTYNVIVEFESDEATHFMITNTDAPYGVHLSITDTPSTSAKLTYEMGYQNSTDGQRGVRLTTFPQSSTVDYTVKAISIYAGTYDANAVPLTWAMDIPSLRETYSEYFPIGNIMEPAQTDNDEMTAMFIYQYNAVTAENSMKPAGISPRKGEYNFTNADKLVDWALDNGIQVHGHTLVWHSQSAPWLNTGDDGKPLTRSEAQANMKAFITEYAGHFSGRVVSWDVVNEAFTDGVSGAGTWNQKLRTNSPWYLAYANGMDEAAGETPEDYLYDAFVFTREAAPDALLVYNDFNEEDPNKREAIASMVEDLNSRWLDDERNTDKDRLLVEVIGMQSHFWTSYLKPADVRASIERFIQTGAQVAVTELDIPTGSYGSFKGEDEEHLKKQADLYVELFEIYKEYSEHILRVTFWGKADHHSWRSEGYPLLFDKNMQPKDAFWRVIEVVSPFEQIAVPEPAPIEPAEPDEPVITPLPEKSPPDIEEESPDILLWVIIGGIALIIIAAVVVIVSVNKKKT